MNDRDTRRYDSFVRIRAFGEDHASDFVPDSVAQVVDALDDAQAGQNRGRNTSKATLLDAIRLDLQNLTRTAAAIAQDEPGFADVFRPPNNINEAALLTIADKFLRQLAAQPGDSTTVAAAKAGLVGKFVAHALDALFVTNLQNDRAAVAAASTQLEQDRESGVGNTAAISPLIQQGMKAATTLDAIMHNRYGSQPEIMAAWLTASHIERNPQRGQAAPVPPPTPAPPKP